MERHGLQVNKVQIDSEGNITFWRKVFDITQMLQHNTVKTLFASSQKQENSFFVEKWTSIVEWLFYLLMLVNDSEDDVKTANEVFTWFDKRLSIIKDLPQIQDYVDMILFKDDYPDSIEDAVKRFQSLKNFLEQYFEDSVKIED